MAAKRMKFSEEQQAALEREVRRLSERILPPGHNRVLNEAETMAALEQMRQELASMPAFASLADIAVIANPSSDIFRHFHVRPPG